MSPPTREDRIAALAALSGTGPPQVPAGGHEFDVLLLRLAGEARRAGATWAAVGEVLGVPGPALAKREVRRLARAVAAGRRYEAATYPL